MVKRPGQHLDLIFGALSDSTRRGILEQLSSGERNVSSLASSYQMSQPAISKHLKVLENAGLISRARRGREHLFKVRPEAIGKARSWMEHYAAHWERHFDAVDAYLKAKKHGGTEDGNKTGL